MNTHFPVLNRLFLALSFLYVIIANVNAQSIGQNKIDSLNLIIESAYKSNNSEKLETNLAELAKIYEYEGNWELYEITVQKMLKIADENDDESLKADCLIKLGHSFYLKGNNTRALELFSEALSISVENNDSLRISDAYESLGVVYKDLANYDNALHYQIQSLKIREKIDQARIPSNCMKLAVIYSLLSDTINQFAYLNRAKLAIQKQKNPDYSQLAILHNEIAGYYNRQNNTDSMLTHYQKVAYYSEKIGWKRGMAVGYGNTAEVYYTLERYDEAIAGHKKVLALSIEIDDCMGIAEEYEYLAVIYEAIGKLDSALILNQKSMEMTYECGLGKEKLNTLQTASRIYETKGNYALALDYNKKYQALRDSLFNIEKQNTITEIETQYQTEKKEQQIELLSVENKIKNQRIQFAIVVILALVLLISLGVFIMIMRKRNSQMAQDELKQKLFRSQMNPHFIFNALGSIQNYMYKNETTKAAQFLGNFASLSRSILKYSSESSIELASEIEMLRNYMELEKMRMPEVFNYEITINNDLETDFIKIPPMMIQPFVENAIKHGFREKDTGGLLKIEFTDKNDLLEVIITDNGVGLNQKNTSDSNHESMATRIFHDRMKYLKKNNQRIPEMSIKDISNNTSTGTKVKLYLPIFN